MSINLKAKETLLHIGGQKGKYRFIMQADTYNTLTEKKIFAEAALRSGLSKSFIKASWEAIGDVVSTWATEGHSVPIPGLGHMRFGIRASSVENVEDVSAKLITSRRIIFNPSVYIKQELANTRIFITCYDRNGKVISTVTSTDTDDVEDGNEENNSGNSGSATGGGTNTGGQDAEPTMYRITFKFSDDTEDDREYAEGATIDYPTPTSGYKWPDSKPNVMPAQDVTVTEVAIG